MSIDAYTGLPGAGKSHGVVEAVVIPSLREGRTIIHNLPLFEDACLALAGKGLEDPSKLGRLVQIPTDTKPEAIVRDFIPGALLVLDEAWRYWPAGKNAASIPEEQREFFAMHRHKVGEDGRESDIVLVCQSLSQVAQFIRDLVDTTHIYSNLGGLGTAGRYRCDSFRGAVTGTTGPAAKRKGEHFGKYKADIHACYKSHSLSEGSGKKLRVDDRGNILKSWRVRFAALAILAVPFVIWYGVRAFYSLGGAPAPAADAERSEAAGGRSAGAPAAVQNEAVPRPDPGPVFSRTWRMAGEITRRGGVFVVLQSLTAVRYLRRGSCLDDDAGDPVCVLDGEIIASWTGAPERTFIAEAATPEAIKRNTP